MYRALPKNHQTPEVDSQFFPDSKVSFHACNLIEAAPGVHPARARPILSSAKMIAANIAKLPELVR
jgi:hypothetical protein